jgi:hypothetical protein
MIDKINSDSLVDIFLSLDISSVGSLYSTCKTFRDIIDTKDIREQFINKCFVWKTNYPKQFSS